MPSIETLTLRTALKKYASVEDIRLVLQQEPQLCREKDEEGWLLLHYACANHASLEIVQFLLEEYPEGANEETQNGVLALHIASANKASLETVEALLTVNPEGINQRSHDGVLPIHYAAACKADASVVQCLVEANPLSLLERTSEGWLPLHYGCRYKADVQVIRILLEAYPRGVRERDYYGWLPLHVACRWKAPVEVIQVLVERYPDAVHLKDVPFVGSTPLDYAIEYHSPTVLLFLKNPSGREEPSPNRFFDLTAHSEEGCTSSIKHGTLTREAHLLLSGFSSVPDAPTWTHRAPMLSSGRWGFAATALDEDRILVSGGYDLHWKTLKSVECYNRRTDSWTKWPDLQVGRNVHASAVCNNRVYVFGGQNDQADRLASIECFNLASTEETRQWTLLDQKLSACGECGAAVAVNQYIYILGGHDDSGNDLSLVEILDTETGRLSIGPRMTTRRSGCAAAVVDSTIWVVGGYDCNWNVLNTAEYLTVEPSAYGGWKLCPFQMSTKRVFPSVATVGHCLIVMGGKDDNGFNLSFVEVFDTKRHVWWRLPNTIAARWAAAAVTLQDTTVVVMGGRSNGETHSSLEAIKLEPVTNEELSQPISELEKELVRVRASSNPFGRKKRREKIHRIEAALEQLKSHQQEAPT